jgi:O-antigen/teichoic acid export membrane protein
MVARMLGVESYGLLAFAYSLSLLCLVVPSFGFDSLVVRELARKPSRASRFLVHISLVRWLFNLPMAGVCLLIVLLSSGDGGRLFIVLIVFLIMATQQHMQFICSFFRAFQDVRRETFVRILLAFLWLLTGIMVLFAGFGLGPFVSSRLAISILCLGFAIFLLKKDFGIVIEKFRWRYAKVLIRTSASLALFHILSMSFNSLNLVILGLIKGDTATGYYSAAEKILTLLFVIPVSLAWATFPLLSKQWPDSHETFLGTYRKAIRYLLLFAIPISIGAFLSGEKVIVLLFGKEFLPSVILIKILSLSIVPFFITQINNTALLSMNKQGTAIRGMILGLIVTLISSLIFIPRLGPVGSALSWTISTFAVLFFELYVLFWSLYCKDTFLTFFRSAFAGCIMAFAMLLLDRFATMLPILVSVPALLYMGMLILLREIKIYEVMLVLILLKNMGRSLLSSIKQTFFRAI